MSIAALAGPTDRVVAIGIDTASVAESRRALDTYGSAYVRRVCSAVEASALPPDPADRAVRLATLWAAKEAATKTLAPALDDSWPWPAIEVDLRSGTVALHGRAAELAGAAGIGRVRVAEPPAPGAGTAPAAASDRAAVSRVTMIALALDGTRPARAVSQPPPSRRTS